MWFASAAQGQDPIVAHDTAAAEFAKLCILLLHPCVFVDCHLFSMPDPPFLNNIPRMGDGSVDRRQRVYCKYPQDLSRHSQRPSLVSESGRRPSRSVLSWPDDASEAKGYEKGHGWVVAQWTGD